MGTTVVVIALPVQGRDDAATRDRHGLELDGRQPKAPELEAGSENLKHGGDEPRPDADRDGPLGFVVARKAARLVGCLPLYVTRISTTGLRAKIMSREERTPRPG